MPKLKKGNLVLAAVAAVVLTACGGGDGAAVINQPSSFTAQSGLAQKGPLMQGSQITINELAYSTFQPSGRSFDFEITNNLGTFDPSGIKFSSPYLSTTAEGYYFNEITGLPSTDTVFLRGVSDLYTGEDTTINVNVLSNFSKNRILNLATGKNLLNPTTGAPVTPTPIKFLKARSQAQAENLNAFYIYNSANILTGTVVGGVSQPANFTALDLSKKRAGDQILAAMSAIVMTAGKDGDGVNTLLSQIEADFADDGLLNNSPKYAQSVQSRLCAAAASTDFSKVATNLNTFYGTTYQVTDLSQWVDTSGCVDQVINKYKFSASNVAVGTVSKSPAYAVGADDVGQCFSVGGVTTGATAGLYYNGAATAVVGTKVVKAGDSVTIGINASSAGSYSGFIQRSAPAANGTCPNLVPSTGVTRVQRYTVNTVSVTTLSVPATNGPWINSSNPSMSFAADASAPTVIFLSTLGALPGRTLTLNCLGGNWALTGSWTGDYETGCGSTKYWLGPQNSDNPGWYVPSLKSLEAEGQVIGAFADNNGKVIGDPFHVPSNEISLQVPLGAVKIQFGINDNAYVDNTGSVGIKIQVRGGSGLVQD